MTILSFKDSDTENFFRIGIRPKKCGWISVKNIARRKLDMIHYAKQLKDLKNPPGNRLETLKGNLKGYYSIRINDQWRIIFKWKDQPYDVSIKDYH